MEDNPLVEPPEIREPDEKFKVVEFYVHLGTERPELQLFKLIHEYLAERAPRTIMGLHVHYQPASERGDPDLLIGNLFLGEPIDIG